MMRPGPADRNVRPAVADVYGRLFGGAPSKRAGLLPSYDGFTLVVDAMLRGGFTPADTAKIVGGNYLRTLAGFLQQAPSLAFPQTDAEPTA